jgi:hypothetical protein
VGRVYNFCCRRRRLSEEHQDHTHDGDAGEEGDRLLGDLLRQEQLESMVAFSRERLPRRSCGGSLE